MKKLLIYLLLLLPLGAAAQAVASDDDGQAGNFMHNFDEEARQREAVVEGIISEAFTHLGARYRKGGKGPNAFDCSGFTQYVFKQQTGIVLGASSRDQYARFKAVKRGDLQRGDLVFFSSPRSGAGVGHVGIVVSVNPANNSFAFIHASTTSGVRVSESTERYYASRYVGARRVE